MSSTPPIFELLPRNGTHVKIYSDGTVTGMPGDTAVINRIPNRLRFEREKAVATPGRHDETTDETEVTPTRSERARSEDAITITEIEGDLSTIDAAIAKVEPPP